MVKAGEDWAHLQTTQVASQFGVVNENSWISTTCLMQNGTIGQYAGGFQAGVQGSRSDEWQSYVDGGDPYDFITTVKRFKALKADNGGYFFLTATDDEDYRLREEVYYNTRVENETGLTVLPYGVAMKVPVEDTPFYIHCVNVPAPTTNTPIQQLQWIYAVSGEVSADSLWRETFASTYSEESWEEYESAMKGMRQLYENPSHDAATMLKALVPPGINPGAGSADIDLILKWLPLLPLVL
jgi:hypothetical protein